MKKLLKVFGTSLIIFVVATVVTIVLEILKLFPVVLWVLAIASVLLLAWVIVDSEAKNERDI